MNKHLIFMNIINRKTNTKILYQDNFVTAFHDINKKAPIHILIVTNKLIASLNDLNDDDTILSGKLLITATKIAKKYHIDKSGYRLIINCNSHGGQEINHLHIHLLGGKPLGNIL
ncbi:MAG: HIT domain-containing protein [Candidatus Lightella neohaematopini]|nr:HIT domain-containing protein [Candidatus Lightella neohaematopini]MCV2531034.1 HIT domain-containing protein [Candidatus Lightella neohaematopini]